MNAINLMVNEHTHIKRMLVVIRKYCLRVMNGEEVDFKDFYKIIDFVRNYADKHHHGKEESMLFNRMIDEIGGPTEKLVKNGMLVEHDLGRLYMKDLEAALDKYFQGNEDSKLDIISNAMGYTYLLTRHIEKEDGVVYKFAERQLSKETLEKIEEECTAFEAKQKETGIQDKYISMLEEFEAEV